MKNILNTFKIKTSKVKISQKAVAWTIAAVFVISLIPLIIMAFYNHPANDDYLFSLKTHKAWQETGSIANVFAAAGQQTKQTYTDWQGSFSAVFMFALQPAIFGERLYFLSTPLMLLSFIGSSMLLWHIILRRYLGASRSQYVIISLTAVFFSIQLMPCPVQGLYWYNGSVYYVFFSSLLMVMLWTALSIIREKKLSRLIVLTVLGCCIAFIIGGGNYVSALLGVLLCASLCLYCAVKKDKRGFCVLAVTALLAAGLIISMAAPGNDVRAQEQYWDRSVISTVLRAVGTAAQYIADWSHLGVLAVLLLLCGIIYPLAAKCRLKFKYPAAVIVISFLFFAAQIAPPIYGMNYAGDGRLTNIIYFSYWYLMLFNCFYICGYIARKREAAAAGEKRRVFNMPKSITAVLLLLAVACPLCTTGGEIAIKDRYTSISAVFSLASGEAEAYDNQCMDRVAEYEDDSIASVVLKPLEQHPYLLYYSDLTQDPDYRWSNDQIRKYYKKDSVIVKWR